MELTETLKKKAECLNMDCEYNFENIQVHVGKGQNENKKWRVIAMW